MSLLLDKNDEKPRTEAHRTVTDQQTSGGDLQVADKAGVPDEDPFEHLLATIADATPLYELCARVLG